MPFPYTFSLTGQTDFYLSLPAHYDENFIAYTLIYIYDAFSHTEHTLVTHSQLTCAATIPSFSRLKSVWLHDDVDQGVISFRFSPNRNSRSWFLRNFLMFHGKSLCLYPQSEKMIRCTVGCREKRGNETWWFNMNNSFRLCGVVCVVTRIGSPSRSLSFCLYPPVY